MKTFLIFSLFLCFARPVFSQKYADILMDAHTGEILHQVDPDGPRFPASLTKIMTLYILFESLKAGKISMETRFTVSKNATRVEPCNLGLKTGQTISVRHIILGMITKSANDASVVAAEGLAGSVSAFANRMNATARKLGMRRTQFYNPHGLPHPEQYSTARDMALLSRALVHHFPHQYKLFGTRRFTFMGTPHPNHNHLLGNVAGVDGIKTGFFRRAGSNIAASAVRSIDGQSKRLIAVVLGGENRFARDKRIKQLLEIGFSGQTNNPAMMHAVYTKNVPTKKKNTTDPIGELITLSTSSAMKPKAKRVKFLKNTKAKKGKASALKHSLKKISSKKLVPKKGKKKLI